MAHPSDLEARVAALEARFEDVASDAAAARHLAAARHRDLADLTVKVDANRKAINALGVQTAARFDRLEEKVDHLEEKVDRLEETMGNLAETTGDGFIEMRGKFDATAAGQQQIVTLLTTLIDQQDDRPTPEPYVPGGRSPRRSGCCQAATVPSGEPAAHSRA